MTNQQFNPPLTSYPEVMTARNVAEYLGISYVKALTLLKSGDLPCVKIGNAYRVSRSQFALWLEQPGFRTVL